MTNREYVLSALNRNTWKEKPSQREQPNDDPKSLVGFVDFISVVSIPISALIIFITTVYSDLSWRFISIAGVTATVTISPLLFGLCKFQGYKQGKPSEILKLAKPAQWLFLAFLIIQFYFLFSLAFL